MSSGHFHARYEDEDRARRDYKKYVKNIKVRKFLREIPFRVDRTYDIPYIGGYSLDGGVIYIDRDLPRALLLGGRKVDVLPFIITHERIEKALIGCLSFKYDEAHKLAAYAGHQRLKERGLSIWAYEQVLDPYIKVENINRIPKDLDLAPYRDSRDSALIKRMKARM